MKHYLRATSLTKESFSSFGDVIEIEGNAHITINKGFTRRYHRLAEVDATAANGTPIISVFRSQPLPSPIVIRMMERHPLGSQAFIPLRDQAFLIVAAPPSENIDVSELSAFISNGRQGVNYYRNVWHHPVLALAADQDFLVIDRDGLEDNCEVFHFSPKHNIILL